MEERLGMLFQLTIWVLLLFARTITQDIAILESIITINMLIMFGGDMHG